MTKIPRGPTPATAANDNDSRVSADLFYTYIWRTAAGVPFYVGKGKGKRAWTTRNRSPAFMEIFSLGGCSVEIADYFIHESQALAHETELIERFGRRDIRAGTLVNLTDGGDGSSGLCDEVRAKIGAANRGNKYALGLTRTRETRARISKSKQGQRTRLGSVLSQESRAKISESLRGKTLSIEHRANLSDYQRGRPKSTHHVSSVVEALRFSPPRADSGSGLKGVSPNGSRWQARININSRRRTIGRFASAEEAARAYDAAAIDAWGRGNCYLNFPDETQGVA